MARPLRPDPVDGWHHVMNRCVDRMKIFRDDADRLEFGALLDATCRRYGIEVHAYCLMTNHFHLLLRCPEGSLSAFMHDLTGAYARYFNHRHTRVGHVFGDRFTSRLVTTHRYIATAVRYIHRNPLDIAGVEQCSDHRWSSHRTYLGLRPVPDWLFLEPVRSWFGDVDSFARFVEGEQVSTADIRTETSEVFEAIDLVLAQHSSLSGRRIVGQRAALALASPSCKDEIITALGLESAGSIRSAQHRARENFRANPENHRLSELVAELLGHESDGRRDAA